jgi:S1-C subfamily serine protease
MKAPAPISPHVAIAFTLAIALPSMLLAGGPPHYLGAVPGEVRPEVPGIALKEVRPHSPADKAGLMAGDIVARIGEIKTRSVEEFYASLSAATPATPTRVIYYRDGARNETDVVLQARRSR